MAYVPNPTDVNNVRLEVQDSETGLYILPDDTYNYILTKNEGSIARSSIDAARMILMRLSITARDSVVDVISLKNSKQADAYRQALILFIRDPSLNPLYNNASGWAGGISRSEIRTNNHTIDNNISPLATTPIKQHNHVHHNDFDYNPFVV